MDLRLSLNEILIWQVGKLFQASIKGIVLIELVRHISFRILKSC